MVDQKSFDRAIAAFLRARYGSLPTQFCVGQYVELTRGFPSAGLRQGDRHFILARSGAIPPNKHAPKGISETYQISGYPNVRFKVEHLKEVL